MGVPPDIQEALAALDEEMGPGARVRLVSPQERERGRRNQARTGPSIDWEIVARWCHEHPGLAFSATVHKNAVYRFRARFPDLRVEGSEFRRHPETGKQIATMTVVYFEPEEGADA